MQKLDKSRLVMNMANKYRLAPYLDKALRTFDEPWEFKYEEKVPDDAWHPSGDCTPSPLELFDKATRHIDSANAEPDDEDVLTGQISESLRKAFMVGHFWHQLLQHIVLHKLEFCEPKAIERRGIKAWGGKETARVGFNEYGLTASGWKPIPFHWTTGSGDLAPLVLPNGWQGVVDFKTMNARTFAKSDVPFADKYECQINIYMDFFDEEKALILGICKDSPHDFKEFEYVRNQPLIDMIYAKWEYVSECLIEKEPPAVELDDDGEEIDMFPLPLRGPFKQ